MDNLTCPFCEEGDFDEIGLCMHLSGGCARYDHACRMTSDYLEQRENDRAIRCARQESSHQTVNVKD